VTCFLSSFEEKWTGSTVAAALRQMGIEVFEGIGLFSDLLN
jgi:hypothetical protein